MARKPLSRRTRFEVFKRDLFTCQYCGRTPPAVVLECDHIDPVAGGGGDEETNLVTACEDCNRGKSAVPLSVVPEALADRAARIAEAEEQIAGFREIMRQREERLVDDIWQIVAVLYGKTETTQARYQSVKMFLGRMPFEAAHEAATIARRAKPYSDPQRFKYFAGVCWRKIREAE